MGAFKPLLPFGPGTVVESCIENLRDGGAKTIVIVVGQEARAEALRAHIENAGVIIATNPAPESEMSDSVACGVLAVPQTIKAVVIIPVDLAAVPGEIVSSLISEWRKGAQLVKPTFGGRGGHPVLVDLKFRKNLVNLNPDSGLKGFFAEHERQVARVDVNSNYIARDMDTWDDYRALHLDVFGVPAPELLSRNPA